MRRTRGDQRGLDADISHAEIGTKIGRDRTLIWREVTRNSNPDGDYHALMAHARASQKAVRPKRFKLIDHPQCARIGEWMDDGWSPKLIAQMLAQDYPGDKLMQVSHETIYRCLYVQTRGSLRADLHKCLSTKRAARKPHGHPGRTGVYNPAQIFTISDRPAEADDRAVPGHWEGDLIMGTGNRSAIGTLVERTTRFTILLHLPDDHTAAAVAAAMIEAMGELRDHLRRSITWDRGSEMADWQDIKLQLDAPVFFCNPHSPWQRGTNENTNRLLRFWFEKGTDLSSYTKADLKRVQEGSASTVTSSPGLSRDDHRRAVSEQSLIGGDADLGALHLTAGGLALQLPGELADLRDRLCRNGFAEAGQPTGRVDRNPAPDGGRPTAQQLLGLALRAQAEVLVPVQLQRGGQVVDLRQAQVLGSDAWPRRRRRRGSDP